MQMQDDGIQTDAAILRLNGTCLWSNITRWIQRVLWDRCCRIQIANTGSPSYLLVLSQLNSGSLLIWARCRFAEDCNGRDESHRSVAAESEGGPQLGHLLGSIFFLLHFLRVIHSCCESLKHWSKGHDTKRLKASAEARALHLPCLASVTGQRRGVIELSVYLKERAAFSPPLHLHSPSGITHSDLTLHELERERRDPHSPHPSNEISLIYLATSHKEGSMFSL